MVNDFDIEIHDGKKTLIKYHGHEQNVILPPDTEVIGVEAFKGRFFFYDRNPW